MINRERLTGGEALRGEGSKRRRVRLLLIVLDVFSS